ncbi:MAG: prolyl-tRNA synthetase associated domain-containing protein [Bacteroidales bacterium]|nr:prolyl-tRNA synthetase associated domain-containing protein [Bacteroidales bacterium]
MSVAISQVKEKLKLLGIDFGEFYHEPIPTIDDALPVWKEIDATHCKNLFFRNHKGNRHYLVIFHYLQSLGIHELEQRLKQGKLSFASEERMMKYLGVKPGSVSPFGLINDEAHHVHLFIDKNLMQTKRISFHPNDNSATFVLSMEGFMEFLNHTRNSYEFIDLY